MKNGFRVVDTDLHLVEPRWLWDRLPQQLRSQVGMEYPGEGSRREPGVRNRVGAVEWTWDFPMLKRHFLRRFEEEPHIGLMHSDAGARPENTLAGMDVEGIDIAVAVPTALFSLTTADGLDPELVAALCRTYNDYAAEFCSANPERLKYWAWLPRQDAELAAEEACRSVRELGAVGVALTTGNVDDRNLSEPFFDPLWDTIEELDVPLGLHLYGFAPMLAADPPKRYVNHPRSDVVAAVLQGSNQAMSAVAELCAGGVLENHPKLRPMIMETASTWLIWLLQRMDDQWDTYEREIEDVSLSRRPSEYFRRQCSIAVECDEQHLAYLASACDLADNLVFTSDYPHHDSNYPHAVDNLIALDLGDELTSKILSENAGRIFGFAPVPA